MQICKKWRTTIFTILKMSQITYILYHMFLSTINWLSPVWGSCKTTMYSLVWQIWMRIKFSKQLFPKTVHSTKFNQNTIYCLGYKQMNGRITDTVSHSCICFTHFGQGTYRKNLSEVKLPSRIFAKWNCRLQNMTLHLPMREAQTLSLTEQCL
jgi:hypothetical protein